MQCYSKIIIPIAFILGQTALAQQASNLNEVKKAQVRLFHQSPQEFCSNNILQRYFNANKEELKKNGIFSAQDPKIAEYERKQWGAISDESGDSGTSGGVPFPGLLIRRYIFNSALNLMFPNMAGTHAESLKRAGEALNPPLRRTAQEVAFDSDRIKQWKTHRYNVSDFLSPAELFALKGTTCLIENPLSSRECVRAFDDAVSSMTPSLADGSDTIGINWWDELFSTSKYDEGIAVAASKIFSRVTNKIIDPTANVWTDLVTSLRAQNMSESDAEHGALLAMGTMASGGPNTAGRMVFSLDNKQIFSALSIIAVALPYLDTLKQSKYGSLYSYPSSVKLTCDNAKPYYFWAAAALAEELVRKGYNKRISETVTVQGTEAYELTRGRAINENYDKQGDFLKIVKRSTYDPVLQIMRTDFAYAAGGALFGAAAASTKIINVDDIIEDLLRKSKPLPALSSDQVKNLQGKSLLWELYRWNQMLAPLSALDSLK